MSVQVLYGPDQFRAREALKAIRDGGVSLRSVHHYMRAIKGFSRWLWRDGRDLQAATLDSRGRLHAFPSHLIEGPTIAI